MASQRIDQRRSQRGGASLNAKAGIVGKRKFSKKQIVASWLRGYRQGCLEASQRYAEEGISRPNDGIQSSTTSPSNSKEAS